jgi:ribosomal protein S18 acetylase RimI-like enzyme
MNGPPAIEVRNAAPADAGAFADLATIASGDLAPVLYGGRGSRMFRGMFLQPKNLSSYRKAFIAAVEGQPAGMLLGFTWREQDAENEKTDWLYLRYLGLRTLWAMLVLSGTPRWFGRASEGEYYINYLAVYPGFRGLGLGMRLLDRAQEAARASGCTALSLDVEFSNEPAISLYRKHGFHVTKEAPFHALRPRWRRVYRMGKDLG